MQGSYERRAPAAESAPLLTRARDGLKQVTDDSPTNAHAWRLLSLAHEALLEYGAAIAALQEATTLSGQIDKRDLKRLARLREAATQWSKLPLSPGQLAALGEHLRTKLAGGIGRRNLRWTEGWLAAERIPHPERVIAALRDRGGFTDFQVLRNVVS